LAFISANRRDFADADGQLLQRLAADGHEHGLTLTFYTSVDDFLKEHALPIEHINVPWVNERLSEEEVIRRLDSAFEDEDWEDFIPWSERGEGWRPYGPPAEDQVYPQLEGVYVWGRSGESIQVLLDYYVQVLRNLPCEREVGDPVVGYWHETRDFDGSLERIAHVSARISGDNIEILDVEGIERA
jgi:hypothetical protein